MNKLSSFLKLIKLFWSNSDIIIKLLNVLGSQLPNVGRALGSAGQMAILTSQVIRGGNGVPLGAAQVVEKASVAVDDCGKKLKDIPAEIDGIRQRLHDVNLPTVAIEDKDYPVLGGVGHVTIPTPTKSDWYPFRDIENFLIKQKTLVQDASSKLEATRQELHLLSGKIVEAGDRTNEIGTNLKEAGRLLEQIRES